MRFVTILLTTMLALPAFADDGRKVNFTVMLTDAYDHPFDPICIRTNPDRTKCEESMPLTLGYACVSALGAGLDADKNEDYHKKLDRDALARKIAQAEKSKTPIALTSEDIVLLKERVGKVWPNATMVGSALRLIGP